MFVCWFLFYSCKKMSIPNSVPLFRVLLLRPFVHFQSFPFKVCFIGFLLFFTLVYFLQLKYYIQ